MLIFLNNYVNGKRFRFQKRFIQKGTGVLWLICSFNAQFSLVSIRTISLTKIGGFALDNSINLMVYQTKNTIKQNE